MTPEMTIDFILGFIVGAWFVATIWLTVILLEGR